jgi:hypothetical protein
MGPPPRNFAADAHECIMVRAFAAHRIQGCGAIVRASSELPSDRHPDRIESAVVLEAVKATPTVAAKPAASPDSSCARRCGD